MTAPRLPSRAAVRPALRFAGGFALAFIVFEIVVVGRGLDFLTVFFALLAAAPATLAWWSVHRALASRRAHRARRGRP